MGVGDRRGAGGRAVGLAPYAAAVWSFAYGALGLLWALGGPGFPYGRGNDPSAALTVFEGARAEVGGPTIAALGLVGGVVALLMALGRARGSAARVLLGFAWAAAGFLLLAVPDYRPLLGIAYAPIVLLGAPFDWPPDVGIADVLPWPVVNQLICMAGGVTWAAAAIVYRRGRLGACVRCGRSDELRAPVTPAGAGGGPTWP